MDCREAQSLISASALIRACDAAPDGSLRIQTAFEYPGNEFVDLFVRPLRPGTPLELTDAGMTVGQLLGFGLDLDATERRRQFIHNVCSQLGVIRDRGELVAQVPDPIQENFGPAAVRLGQACVRIADLIITHQSRLNSSFSDEVEEGLEALRLPLEIGAPLLGDKGRDVKVDYIVHAPRVPAAIYALSAKSPPIAQQRVDATFRKWYELRNQQENYQFVTLLDSRAGFWGEANRGVLEDVSQVFEYPAEADALRELVTAD